MHFLDTDTVRFVHSGRPNVIRCLRETPDPEVGITVVTRIEMLQGRFDFLLKAATASELLKAYGLLQETDELLAELWIVPLDEKAAIQFDRLKQNRTLKRMGRADLLIASITLAYNATLVTRNLRHFKIVPNLKVVNWVD